MFDSIFEPWDGEFTKRSKDIVKSIIERADMACKNQIFKWYINVVTPYIKKQAVKEYERKGFKNGDTDNYPIHCLLIKIVIKYNILNENDENKFNFDVWIASLNYYKEILDAGKCKSLQGIKVPAPPPSEELISFREVINVLLKAKFETESDDALKKAWTK